ncbi:MAG: pyridoxal-phosphate dependent enzyme, partial [Rhodospirillales bacterium]|nr:pyridoxal-phosphate dependent enzyme [Acetobacter sp.]
MSESNLISLPDIVAARDRIRGVAVYTPLVRVDERRLRAVGFPSGGRSPELWLKNEAAQPIGSFKLRGAYNKMAALRERNPEALQRGVITFSSGNHAQGVAYAARALGTKAVIVMPNNAPTVKRDATEALGAEVVTVGPASSERKRKAEALVAEHGYAMIPPYDDMDIIGGQATCGLEIAEQLAALGAEHSKSSPGAESIYSSLRKTVVLSPVSGGGLLSGVASGLKLAGSAVTGEGPQVWGCEPELAGDARESFYSRALVEWPAASTSRTLADGLRTQSLGELNFR